MGLSQQLYTTSPVAKQHVEAMAERDRAAVKSHEQAQATFEQAVEDLVGRLAETAKAQAKAELEVASLTARKQVRDDAQNLATKAAEQRTDTRQQLLESLSEQMKPLTDEETKLLATFRDAEEQALASPQNRELHAKAQDAALQYTSLALLNRNDFYRALTAGEEQIDQAHAAHLMAIQQALQTHQEQIQAAYNDALNVIENTVFIKLPKKDQAQAKKASEADTAPAADAYKGLEDYLTAVEAAGRAIENAARANSFGPGSLGSEYFKGLANGLTSPQGWQANELKWDGVEDASKALFAPILEDFKKEAKLAEDQAKREFKQLGDGLAKAALDKAEDTISSLLDKALN